MTIEGVSVLDIQKLVGASCHQNKTHILELQATHPKRFHLLGKPLWFSLIGGDNDVSIIKSTSITVGRSWVCETRTVAAGPPKQSFLFQHEAKLTQHYMLCHLL
jgi:hypothetical protein